MDQISDRELSILFSLVNEAIEHHKYIHAPENQEIVHALNAKIRRERGIRNLDK